MDVALLRAAAWPLIEAPDRWPDLTDTAACRVWLDRMWSRPDLADAVRQASPSLADRVDTIRTGRPMGDKQIRRATTALTRYVLRAFGRPTPFGLFAGVTPVRVDRAVQVRWGEGHRPAARVTAEWLADVIAELEAHPDLLERLDIAVNDLAVQRGRRLEVPQGPNRVTIRYTDAVAAVRDAATDRIRFGVLADRLAEDFQTIDRSTVRATLTELVRQGFLLTDLHAPFTITDPLAHIVHRLRAADADTLPAIAPLLRALQSIQAEVHHHNQETTSTAERSQARETVTRRMRRVSQAGRTPLAVDLLLDADVRLPRYVVHEMERAASALLRLTRHPAGEPVWWHYREAFADRYGTGTLVPLADVLDPDAGLGYPAGYPGSVLPAPTPGLCERDERLLALAWQAMAEGSIEIVLTEETVVALTDNRFDARYIPPHVELSARIHAASDQALTRGDYTLTVAPARSAGTLTSRFTPMAGGSGLAEVYRALPAATTGAIRVQLSFGPVYPHAENVCRVPAYLDHVLPLGEHRGAGERTLLAVNDLAVTATRERLHLVSVSRRQVVEPQVFHALALDKQSPPLARFLAQLPRAFSAAWYQFDWGPHARLPFLPRVRYRRTVLSPAQWRLATSDLPPGEVGQDEWRQVLDRWRTRWRCPDLVELRDADRTLRLSLDEPAHAALLDAHLTRHGHAILTEAASAAEFGWIDGRAHEIAFPLVTTRAAAPNPLGGSMPSVTNAHGQLPGASTRLSVKMYTHPERMDEIIAEYLTALETTLGTSAGCWWLRYHSPHETDHIRLRIRTDRDTYAARTRMIGDWVQRMRRAGMIGRLAVDTYYPEIGRYGHGPALDAAEDVFAADSHAVAAALRDPPGVHRTALTVMNMVGIVSGFFADPGDAMDWLAGRSAVAAALTDRAVAQQAIRLATGRAPRELPGWSKQLDQAWQARGDALAAYRRHLPPDADVDAVLESLLHMHHNRSTGIDSDSERICRRLARQAALTWRARQQRQ
jgi:thiopeptide-type bacteriocin biosynthesis protein